MAHSEKVSTHDLRIGMTVTDLDRPWLETPFLLQGFIIQDDKEIQQLQEFCEHVFIEPGYVREPLPKVTRSAAPRRRRSREDLLGDRGFKIYTDQSDWQQEYPKAQVAVSSLAEGVNTVYKAMETGSGLEVARIKESVEPMIESVTRNPDACIWLARMKQVDNYTYQHAVGTSIWAVALGRQLGLPHDDLQSLAVGGLLMDVGKLDVPADLLNAQRRLSPEEFAVVKEHVGKGIEAISLQERVDPLVYDMVAHHHERLNGQGYPRGLVGDEIPIFGRIGGIVDTYDAITSHRSYDRALPPAEAVKLLYKSRDVDFQAEIVEEFIQAIGIYPAGTLVELSSGEIAVIVAEYRTRRLRPRVLVMLDENKQPVQDQRVIDLMQSTHTASGAELSIVRSLEPDAYGIDMRGIRLN